METASTAKPVWEISTYQERARLVLPRLVLQARTGKSIFYSELAMELRIPNARNLNWPLGSVGESLRSLSRRWGEDVPPLQALVVNKASGLPGTGFDGFVKGGYRQLPRWQRERRVAALQAEVVAYSRWPEVLAACGLEPLEQDFTEGIARSIGIRRSDGESEDHKRLKAYVAANPRVVGLRSGCRGKTEYGLPSGDSVDVVFDDRDEWTAVEVKPARSPEEDIRRGIFQCIKYGAVGWAWQSLSRRPKNVRAILVLEGALPDALVQLKNLLAVEVIQNVEPA